MDAWSCYCSYCTARRVCHIMVMWSKLCLAKQPRSVCEYESETRWTSTLLLQTKQRSVSLSQLWCACYKVVIMRSLYAWLTSQPKKYRAERSAIGLCCSSMILLSEQNLYVKKQALLICSRVEVATSTDGQAIAVVVVYILKRMMHLARHLVVQCPSGDTSKHCRKHTSSSFFIRVSSHYGVECLPGWVCKASS